MSQTTITENFKYKGTRVYYEVRGEGEPLVMLHGALLARPWNGVNKKLAEKFKVYDLVLPGFDGNAIIKNRINDFELYLDVVKSFLDHTGLKSPHMLGFSVGSILLGVTYVNMGLTSQIILCGFPQNLDLKIGRLFYLLPYKLRRWCASKDVVQRKIIYKLMMGNLNSPDMTDHVEKFIEYLQLTHPGAVSDMNYETVADTYSKPTYQKLMQTKDRVLFMYGEKDTQRKFDLVENYETIPGKYHGMFDGKDERQVSLMINHLSKKHNQS